MIFSIQHHVYSCVRRGRFLYIALFAMSMGCSPNSQNARDSSSSAAGELPKVATVKAIRKPIVQKTEQPGRIEAFTTTPIYAKVSGFLDRLLVDIGDRVAGPKLDEKGEMIEEGQLLAQLIAPELDEELRQKSAIIVQSAAEVEQARAAVLVAESIAASSQASVDECVAGEHRTEALFQRAKSEADRIETLVTTKTVNQKLADEAQQQLKAADAAREETAAKLRSATAKQKEANIAILKSQADLRAIGARLQVAEADRDRVKTLCGYLQIRAPFSGIITQRNVDTGLLIQAARGATDTPLFVLMQADVVRLHVDVPESDAALVVLGSPATVTVPALGVKSFQGTIARTGWALQAGTRALNCEIDVPNSDGILRPGMYAQVDLTIAQKPDALTLPKAAVVQMDGQSVCLAVDGDGRLIRKPVQTGIRSATEVEILSGLDGTEDILASNVAAFKEGQSVEKATK